MTNKMTNKKITVGTRVSEEGQHTIYVSEVGTANKLDIIRMVPKADMYKRGLEDKFKPLVDMTDITAAMASAIQAYIGMREFGELSWKDLYNAFKPFIDSRLKFERVFQFIYGHSEGDWE